MGVSLRLATQADVPALTTLIHASARALSAAYYTAAETEAAIRYVFGVDTQLVDAGTYFVAEDGALPVGCGGWSRHNLAIVQCAGKALNPCDMNQPRHAPVST